MNVIKIAPETAFKFMAYEQVACFLNSLFEIVFCIFEAKRTIQRLRGSRELSIFDRFAAGSSAGAISQSLIYPLEV